MNGLSRFCYLVEFDVFEKGDFMETIRNVEINQLHDFRNHPFKVEVNTELCELMKSIEKEGVLVPLLVRTNPYGDGYEVRSGHRRLVIGWMIFFQSPLVC